MDLRLDVTPGRSASESLAKGIERRDTASVLVREFAAAGIRHLLFVPGGPLMPFLSAAERARSFRFILCRHEAGAGLAAEGLARATRQVAVVAVTAGPGVTNVLTAGYVAFCEGTPLVILSAQVPRSANGRGAAQELDTVRLLEPIMKRSVALSSHHDPTAVVRSLLFAATSGRQGPVHLSVTADQWKEEK